MEALNSYKDEGLFLLDYGAGNVRSLVNAINKLGYSINIIKSVEDFELAKVVIFPGVGDFGEAIRKLNFLQYLEPLKKYLSSDKPFLGICVGMQVLFAHSEESPGTPGIGLIPYSISKFKSDDKCVPHMGWNSAHCIKSSDSLRVSDDHYYFVHSYAAKYPPENFNSTLDDWAFSLTTYGTESFISSVKKGNKVATQFHPEKSGVVGLNFISRFLTDCFSFSNDDHIHEIIIPKDALTRRIIACLDVRANDDGDLVVTKGEQYDVREKQGDVRNLGKPVSLAQKYYQQGADEIVFLNITSFRDCPLNDAPMLKVLQETCKSVFVPLTIGGGIRDIVDPDGTLISAVQVAGEYFRAGADKVSIGSDAVFAAETLIRNDLVKTGTSSIEQIAKVYGSQAVVISVDPKRVYVKHPNDTNHNTIETKNLGPNEEKYCWYQCTVKGGREDRDLDVIQLVNACEILGAGEILVNCMDKDGSNSGYDLELLLSVKSNCKLPVIASSGAGKVEHFEQVFVNSRVDAALAAGIFHRDEVPILHVKNYLKSKKFQIRNNN